MQILFPPSQVQIHRLLATSKMLPPCLPSSNQRPQKLVASLVAVVPSPSSRRVKPFWYGICYRRGVAGAVFVFLALAIVYPNNGLICDGHEDLSSC